MEVARFTTGLRRRVADAVLSAGADSRTNRDGGRVREAAGTPVPREKCHPRASRTGGPSRKGCATTRNPDSAPSRNPHSTIDRPKWPWDEWIPPPLGRIAPPHASRTRVRLQCPHPTAPRFQPNLATAWGRCDAELAREPPPTVDLGFAKRWKKSTLSPRDREPSSTEFLTKHVSCRASVEAWPRPTAAAKAGNIGGIREAVMEEMTTKLSKPARRGQSGGKFFQPWAVGHVLGRNRAAPKGPPVTTLDPTRPHGTSARETLI